MTTITPAFGKWSSAGGSVDAGKQGVNTMQVQGATFSSPGGQPTMIITPATIGAPSYSQMSAVESANADIAAGLVSQGARISAVEIGQSSAVVGYATQAALYADLVPVDKSVAYVGNDPTPSKNGTYLKSGATGAGSWIQNSFDRVAATENRVTATENKIALYDQEIFDYAVPRNLYNPAAINADHYMNVGGAPGTTGIAAGWGISEFIPVTANTVYTISSNANRTAGIAFYTGTTDGSYISGSLNTATNGPGTPVTVTSPATATYMRINIYDPGTLMPSQVQIEQGTTATAFEAYHLVPYPYIKPEAIAQITSRLDTDETNISNLQTGKADLSRLVTSENKIALYDQEIFNYSAPRNLYNPATINAGHYLNTGLTPGATGVSAAFGVTGFIPVSANTAYTVSVNAYRTPGIAFYTGTTDGSYISGSLDTSASGPGTPVTVTSPAGAAYMRINIYETGTTAPSQVQIEQGTTATAFQAFTLVSLPYLKPAALSVVTDRVTATENRVTATENKIALYDQEIFDYAVPRNLYNPAAINADHYMNVGGAPGTTGIAAGWGVSGFIPVSPGLVYTVSTNQIRCPGIAFYTTANDAGYISGSLNTASNGPDTPITVTAPAGANFLRMNIHNADFDAPSQVQLEQNTVATAFQAFTLVSLPYLKPEIFPTLDSAKNTLTLGNSDTIVNIGDSYTASHYALKDKAYISNLSNLSEYRHQNFGVSGNDALDMNQRVLEDTAYFDGKTFSDMSPRFAFIAACTNDGQFWIADETYYQENVSRLVETVRARGAEPIICTEFTASTSEFSALKAVADKYGLRFVDCTSTNYEIGTLGIQMNPFFQGHPGTRTNGVFWLEMLKALDAMPRPRQGIKIFRRRPTFTVSAVSDLLYHDRVDRYGKFKELGLTQYYLGAPADQHYDEINNPASYTTGITLAYDEYWQIQQKELVAFSDYGLIEIILPGTSETIDEIEIDLGITAAATVYVRDYTDVTASIVGRAQGMTPTDADYLAKWNKPRGAWRSLGTYAGTIFTITGADVAKSMEKDKVVLLIYGSSGFDLFDVQVNYKGRLGKDDALPRISDVNLGAELLAAPGCSAAEMSGWTTQGSPANLVPIDNYNSPRKPSDVTLPVAGVVVVSSTATIAQTATVPNPGVQGKKYRLRVYGRYFPKAFLDNSVYLLDAAQVIDRSGSGITYPSSSQVTPDTADLRTVRVEYTLGTSFPSNGGIIVEDFVCLSWRDLEFDVFVPPAPFGSTSITFRISSPDGQVQIAKVSLREII